MLEIAARRYLIFSMAYVALLGFAAGISAFAQVQSLDTEPIHIQTSRGSFSFDIEIADEPRERTIGLMNRDSLDNRGGMLFVFDQPRVITMWMKNTRISLDMIFINSEGRVVTIAERTTPQSLDLVSSQVPVDYVLELNGGMAAFIGMKPGDQLDFRLFNSG